MKTTKKCAVCGSTTNFNSKYPVDKYVTPTGFEEKYFFELWHKPALECPVCGYTSFDLNICKDLRILKDKQFMSVADNKIVARIDEFKQTNLPKYLRAGSYYNLIGDMLNEGISYLLASEEVNRALIYYIREVVEDFTQDNPDEVEVKLNKYSTMLFDYGVSRLELLYDQNNQNIDLNILLGGILAMGDAYQVEQGIYILSQTKKMSGISLIQLKTIEYLLNKAIPTKEYLKDEE